MAAGRRTAGGDVRLVVVESPNKVKSISSYLGDDYVVESSIGHIRDLPRNAADVPAKYKGEPWARLGVDTEHDFAPLYVVPGDKKAQVAKLKSLLADASELYLATDGDREGEAIAWHLLDTLKPKVPVKRMVFHEITPAAIRAAAESAGELNVNLVDAQETRRILDRLYGYEVSPVLWKKVMPKLSAGRVQSVATRIIVQRERERMAFVSGTYWGMDGTFVPIPPAPDGTPFAAALASVNGRRLADGRSFDPSTGRLTAQAAKDDVLLLDEDGARALAAGLASSTATVTSVEERPYTRKPYAPFMTSTLQQEAGRKLGMSSERTMRTAQRLYESGYITYMRTDSTTLSQTALDAARAQVRELYGPDYLPAQPRQYTRKVKNAQEAHEAIRPAGDAFRTPGQISGEFRPGSDEYRLYELIWKRTVASQMVDARGQTLTVRITAQTDHDGVAAACVFHASGRTITFPGFLRVYVETVDAETGGDADDAERRLPQLREGQKLDIRDLVPGGHSTNPPARYTEPSLVKAMEDLGIGRPSTYASIIRTITDRGYVWKKGQALVPSWVAFAVVGLMEKHFSRLVDYDFTAAMEDELDSIAAGRLGRTDWLKSFYYGGEIGPEGGIGRSGGLKQLVGTGVEDIDPREINSLPLLKSLDGRQIVVRVGRFGPYLERPAPADSAAQEGATERANLPDELAPDEVTAEVAEELFGQAGAGDRVLGVNPASGFDVVVKDGRYGPYVTEVLPEGTPTTGKNAVKARTASLLSSMSIEGVGIDDALKLFTLPRVVGTDPGTGDEITAQNGRYGPYLKKGTDSRSLATEEAMFTVTLDEALALYAQPKTRGRAAASAAALRELGEDPATGKPMVIKDGRFGPYVTDGETNASLRKGDEVESLTIERGAELLADRRAKGPAPKRTRKAAAAKPAAARSSTTTRTAAKRAPAKSRKTGS